jgi:acyl carrier protein
MAMEISEVKTSLKSLVVDQLVEGTGEGITDSTPLLELGLINSLSIMMVVGFIQEKFGVTVPSEHLTPENLKSIQSISEMVLRLR